MIAIFIAFFFAYTLAIDVPLSSQTQQQINDYGELISDDLVQFLNKEINMQQYQQSDGGWSNEIECIVDGVEYKNWGQFQSSCVHLRNLFKKGSVSKSGAATVEIIDDYTFSAYFCLSMELKFDIGFGSTSLHFCVTTIKYFDADGAVYKWEGKSDGGILSTIFNYILRSATTMLPDTEGEIVAVYQNPVLLTIFVLIISFTLLLGVVIGCIFKKTNASKVRKTVKGNKYDVVIQESDASEINDLM